MSVNNKISLLKGLARVLSKQKSQLDLVRPTFTSGVERPFHEAVEEKELDSDIQKVEAFMKKNNLDSLAKSDKDFKRYVAKHLSLSSQIAYDYLEKGVDEEDNAFIDENHAKRTGTGGH